MKIIRKIAEAEMVATFLKGEIQSERFKQSLLDALQQVGGKQAIVESPDLINPQENQLRELTFIKYRGWKSRDGLFAEIPSDMQWYETELSLDELLKAKYINYSYWNELTGGTRLVKDGVESVKSGKTVFDVSNDRFWAAAGHVQAGKTFVPLILVDKKDGLEILEGHLRATAYGLAGIPSALRVVLGKVVK